MIPCAFCKLPIEALSAIEIPLKGAWHKNCFKNMNPPKIVKNIAKTPKGDKLPSDLPALLADMGRRIATLQEILQEARRLSKTTE